MSTIAARSAILAAASAIAGAAVVGLAVGGSLPPAIDALFGVLVVVVSAAVGYTLARDADRVIADISTVADRLPESGFSARAAPADGPVSGLSGRFNAMAGRAEAFFTESLAEHHRLEAVFNASADGMVALGRDTGVRFLNPAAALLLAASPGTAVGRPLIESARDYELVALVRRVADAGEPELTVITYGPARLSLRAAALPIRDGGDWAVLLVLTDLTEVNRIDRLRRDFLTNVSHELRTPLASIQALAETLDSGHVDPGPDTEEFAHRIRQQVERLTLLINELLDLSRIESGAVELHPEPIELHALVSESALLLRQRAEGAGVSIVRLPGEAVSINADRPSLLRVINNLLDNAIKYSPRGGEIEVAVTAEEELAVITVRDHGPGISANDLPRVFERFYKGDASRAASGVGLGLAMVKHIVRVHGGAAEVASSPGEGAIFTVRLPREFVGLRSTARRTA